MPIKKPDIDNPSLVCRLLGEISSREGMENAIASVLQDFQAKKYSLAIGKDGEMSYSIERNSDGIIFSVSRSGEEIAGGSFGTGQKGLQVYYRGT